MNTSQQIRTDAERQWMDWNKHQVKVLANRVINDGWIHDTNTAVFTRQLAQVLARQFDRRYSKLIAKEMMQAGEPINPGASTIIAQGHDVMGEAVVTRDYTTEIPRATIQGSEETLLAFGIISSFFLGYQQLREYAFAGVPGAMKIQEGAFRVVAERMDSCLSTGNTAGTITGMINNAAIAIVSPGVPAAFTGAWANAAATTDAQVMADIAIVKALIEGATDVYMPDTLAVSPAVYNRLATPLTLAGYAPNLLYHIEQTFELKVKRWWRLTGQSTTTPGQDRCIMYENSLDVFNPLVSVGPEMFPPVNSELGYAIGVHARCAGVEVAHSLGAYYLDMT